MSFFMEYLQKEFENYLNGRVKGKSFEEISPLKAHAFRSLYSQIGKKFSRNKIMEVGCGSGYFLSMLANDNFTLGLDINPVALDYSKAVFNEKQVDGKFELGDGFKLSYGKDTFDLVFNVGVIEHFDYESQLKFIENMKNVSKNYVLISTPNDDPNSLYQSFKKKSPYYIPEEENLYDLEKLVKLVGLKPIKKGGFHIISRESICNDNLKKHYKKKCFNPKEAYSSEDLDSLLVFESSFSDDELYHNSFLKYVLAEKI